LLAELAGYVALPPDSSVAVAVALAVACVSTVVGGVDRGACGLGGRVPGVIADTCADGEIVPLRLVGRVIVGPLAHGRAARRMLA
jgi:hypothetical protein